MALLALLALLVALLAVVCACGDRSCLACTLLTACFALAGYVTEDHVIEITGWGVEKGVKYWVVRNRYAPALACPEQCYIGKLLV